MDLQILALDLQEAFLIVYGPLVFWSLVFGLVAVIGLVIMLPFLSINDGEKGGSIR